MMKNNTETCVIYSRVSTERQKNESQINDLRAYAKYMKFKIVGVYDEKISGSTKATDRLAFKELINFVNLNEVDHLLVWELSRLGRNLRDILESIEFFTKKKINVFSKKENINTLNSDKTVNETTRMILGIMGSVAQYEKTMIVERSKRGLVEHIKAGGSWSLPPYGYKSSNKKFVIDTHEGKYVKQIFKLFIEGMASPSIAKHLNLENIKTKKGLKWNDVQIRDILHNSMYYGKRKFSFGYVDAPAIISKSDYLKAQQIFDENRNLNKDKAVFTNYLNGLIKCGECGFPYYQHARRSKKDFAYKCYSKKKVTLGQIEKKCDNRGININLLNSMVYYVLIAVLIEFSHNESFKSQFAKMKKKQDQQLSNVKREIRILKTEIEKGEKKLKRISDLLIREILSEADYIRTKDEITKGIERNGERLNQLLVEESNIKPTESFLINDLKKLIPDMKKKGIKSVGEIFEMDIELYQYLIEKFIKSIVIHKSGISDNSRLENVIPQTNHKRILKITISSLFREYHFFTVSGFKKYSFQTDENNNLFPINLVPEICQ